MDKEQFDNIFKPMLREKNIYFYTLQDNRVCVDLNNDGEVDIDFEGKMTIYQCEGYCPYYLHKKSYEEIIIELESLLEESKSWT